MVGSGGGVALFTRALLESESIESDETTCILGPVIAFIIIHGCDFQIIEGEIGFSSYGGEVTFVEFEPDDSGDGFLTAVDQGLKGFAFGRVPESVVNQFGVARNKGVAQVHQVAVHGQRFELAVGVK